MIRVSIIGAGVGGLSAAISLRQAGADVTVYEQSPEVREIGAGIILAPNAVRLLDRFGLGAEIRSRACAATAHVFQRWTDASTILRDEYGPDFVSRFGTPSLSIHRGELVGILARALPEGVIQLGHRLSGLSQADDAVRAEFEDGHTADSDVLVGADGIRSTVADQIGLPTRPRSSGLAAYRGLVPATAIADLNIEPAWTGTLGPGRHFVHYFVSAGSLLNFVGIVPSDFGGESWMTPGDVRQARLCFAGWHPQVREILERIDSVTLWGLFERPARSAWSVGRIVLAGDAAHPMLPTFAQGAAQAIEDAVMLGCLLGSATSAGVPQALRTYTSLRLPRVRRIQALARRNAVMFHLPDGPDQRERDARIGTPAGGDPWRNNAWVYAYDPAEHWQGSYRPQAS